MISERKNVPLPPRLPEWIVTGLAWNDDRGSIRENLREEYAYVKTSRGKKPADLWYWGQMIRSLFPSLRFFIYWRLVMFKNTLKLVLRNLVKHKGYSLINIAGLAVGLACFILISLWLGFEISYDRFHENKDDLYQVIGENRLPNGDLHFFSQTPAALAQALQAERPEIRHISRSLEWMEFLIGTEDRRYLERVRFVDPDFLKMFSLEFITGHSETALSQPHSIILTENIAKKHFPDQNVFAKEVAVGSLGTFLVTGIIKEMPANSSLSSLCLLPMEALRDIDFDIDRWSGGNFSTFVHLEEKANPGFFNAQIRDLYKKYAPNWEGSKLSLRPITRIHLYALNGGGPIVYVYIFSGLSVFILLLAIVNFTNLSTALSFLRAKEIGVRKAAGAYKQQLTKQILSESILVTLFSAALAVLISYFLLPVLNQLTGTQIGFAFNGKTVLFLAGVVVLTGILSGIYPAFFLASMNPVRAIKGAIKPGKNNLQFRKVLIGFQFSLSIFMIIAMIGVHNQLKYLKSKDLGYNRENIIELGLDQELSNSFRSIQAELMRNPEIISVTRSSSNMETESTTTGGPDVTWEGNSGNIEMPRTHLIRADPEFTATFQIEMLDGRFFSNEFPADVTESAVINETARKAMDLKSPVGKRLSIWDQNFRIIGVIKDFHFYSLHDEIQPLIFVHRYAGFSYIFIRIHSQYTPKTLSFIRDKIREIIPGYVPDLKFLDDSLNNIYATEQRMATGTRYFTFLAIFISCIGLLGLTSFSVRQRTKEIAVRKVLGASEGNIVVQLFKETLTCVIAANAVAIPIAYFVLQGWYRNYAYRTTPGVGLFILASVLTVALAFLSVGWNVVRASLADPVESLRYE
jgi:ABC-type antimicrobial peptide transport system permease subunit